LVGRVLPRRSDIGQGRRRWEIEDLGSTSHGCVSLSLSTPSFLSLVRIMTDACDLAVQAAVYLSISTVSLRSRDETNSDSSTIPPQRPQVRDCVPRHPPLGDADCRWGSIR